MKQDVVQSLWIGNRLSTMEQLCIRSFLKNGHPFHLYVYQDVEGIPDGTTILPGSDILPAKEIFVYAKGRGKGNPSAFSNFFRYKLLLERGGWWADLDAVCLHPLQFDDPHVFGFERERKGGLHVAAGLMRMPTGSPIAAYCWLECQKVDRRKIRWGEIGPRLVARGISSVDFSPRILPPESFYPIDYMNAESLVLAGTLPTSAYSIHLWNSCWRAVGLDPDGTYPPSSLYEQLKQRFCDPASACVRAYMRA